MISKSNMINILLHGRGRRITRVPWPPAAGAPPAPAKRLPARHRHGIEAALASDPMAASSLPVSIFLIARNEADRIGRTLAAVQGLSDDLLVVDSGSTDGTQADRRGLRGARGRSTPGPATARRSALPKTQCRHRWVLNIDADEVMPPDLVAEMRALFATGEPPLRCLRVSASPRCSRSRRRAAPLGLSRWRRSGSTAPTAAATPTAWCTTGWCWSRGARVGRLNGRIHHFSVRSLGEQIAKLNAYTDQQVDDLDQRGETLSAWRLVVEFPAAFLKAYVGRRHFVRGRLRRDDRDELRLLPLSPAGQAP